MPYIYYKCKGLKSSLANAHLQSYVAYCITNIHRYMYMFIHYLLVQMHGSIINY